MQTPEKALTQMQWHTPSCQNPSLPVWDPERCDVMMLGRSTRQVVLHQSLARDAINPDFFRFRMLANMTPSPLRAHVIVHARTLINRDMACWSLVLWRHPVTCSVTWHGYVHVVTLDVTDWSTATFPGASCVTIRQTDNNHYIRRWDMLLKVTQGH